jgi:hypothetical protein
MPAIDADKKVDNIPHIIALTANLAKSFFLLGEIAPKHPICIPI